MTTPIRTPLTPEQRVKLNTALLTSEKFRVAFTKDPAKATLDSLRIKLDVVDAHRIAELWAKILKDDPAFGKHPKEPMSNKVFVVDYGHNGELKLLELGEEFE